MTFERITLINADCLEHLKSLPDDSLDSLVTDPPAGIFFMGKEWDKAQGGRDGFINWLQEVMSECLRVLKPGAHGLVWSIPRTSHWTAFACEKAGFEVRDCITHLFGSGFPKSQNISKAIDKAAGAEREIVGAGRRSQNRSEGWDRPWQQKQMIQIGGSGMAEYLITAPATPEAKQWDGWGTALKPAAEFWWLVRKPLGEKTVAKNVLKYGTGGINIDGCRVETDDNLNGGAYSENKDKQCEVYGNLNYQLGEFKQPQGRFPANLILDESAVAELDAQSGVSKSSSPKRSDNRLVEKAGNSLHLGKAGIHTPENSHNDTGGASRFFYVAKASKRDKGADNTHPTVKNTKLMEYLIKLVTPPGGIVLDPFMGSGSTGVASKRLGFGFYGIEMDADYCEIAKRRIESVSK